MAQNDGQAVQDQDTAATSGVTDSKAVTDASATVGEESKASQVSDTKAPSWLEKAKKLAFREKASTQEKAAAAPAAPTTDAKDASSGSTSDVAAPALTPEKLVEKETPAWLQNIQEEQRKEKSGDRTQETGSSLTEMGVLEQPEKPHVMEDSLKPVQPPKQQESEEKQQESKEYEQSKQQEAPQVAQQNQPAQKPQGPSQKPQSAKKTNAKMDARERQELLKAEKIYQEGITTIRDLIAPGSMEIRYDSLHLEGVYTQTFYVYTYPRFLDTNWLSPVINFDATMDIAQFIYPIDSSQIMKVLKKKVAQMQSAVRMASEKGTVSDPALETALQDAEELRTQIQRGQEKFFQFALYFTVYADDEKKLQHVGKQLESMLGSKLVLTKKTQLQMEHGFHSTLPLCLDELEVATNMNTSPLSTTFPFSSSDLTSNEGILYGLNRHNDSLVIFDRFSLENANSVVFAKSGAGKSYAVKLEILRSMMLGTDVIVIDPENEYEALCQTVGGSYLRVSLTSERRINPFDLPSPLDEEEVQPGDLLRSNIINLHGLLKIMLGGTTPEEEALLDRALIDVYAIKGITMEMANPSSAVPPTMEDLQEVLGTMEGAQGLAQRLQKYTSGTYAGLFNKPTNVDLESGLMVFCIRDLEDSLRPIAMYIILNYIWARVRSRLKKRILVIDEAWTMMQYEDSAKFLFGLVKRARKYYLGITTITQDVEDFVKSSYGKPVITNSSLQLLLKQAPAAIEILAKVFNLTEGEKYMLLNSAIGQGLFFAGLKHVAIQVIASYTEDKIITTDPEELLINRSEALQYAETSQNAASEEGVQKEVAQQEDVQGESSPQEETLEQENQQEATSEEGDQGAVLSETNEITNESNEGPGILQPPEGLDV